MSEKIRLQIIGGQQMHCTGCEQTVSFILSQLQEFKKSLPITKHN